MTTGSDAALVTRTEYVTGTARMRQVIGTALLLGALPLLVVLALLGVTPDIVVAIVGAAVTGSLGLTVFGASVRPTVRLGLADEQVIIGIDAAHAADSSDVVRPLTELVGVELSSEAASETHVAPEYRDLRVEGCRFLRLTFVDGGPYQVAVHESDPVAEEIIRRLRKAQPQDAVEESADDISPTPSNVAAPTADDAAAAEKTSADRRDAEQPTDQRWHTTPSASPAADIRLWEASRTTHRRVLSEYGAYELDPTLFLRYPGVTDITRDPVMDFHTALAEAQALATDTYPEDAAYAGRYRAAVDTLRRTWIRCERDGKATGTNYLDQNDRCDLDTAAKLYNHAQATDHAAEKTSYLRKAQQIVVDLEARGRVHLPRPVVAAIEAQVRLALEPGTTRN
ncbi:hypothetical protein [Nocardia callitridis]|uniref:hypothetical protein n=1 Tax=Nocardia callitridis TaxID=648753 RepID=UPI0031F1B5E1